MTEHRLGPLVLAPWQRAWLETFLGPRFAPEHGLDDLSAWLDTVTIAAPPPPPVLDLDELFAQARRTRHDD